MRIAIVCYHFPPSTMVAAVRARGLAKYLARAGHQITVVTAEQAPEASPDWTAVSLPGRTPSSRMREALGVSQHHAVVDALSGSGAGVLAGVRRSALAAGRRFAQEVVFWPDEAAGWSRQVRSWLDANARSLDAIVTSSPPPSTHLAALSAKRGDAVWVADYRDLWSLAHHYPYSAARHAIDRRWDARVLAEADAVTVATEGFARVVREAYPAAAERVFPVYNGFDPDAFADTAPARGNAALTLVHAGNLYGGRVDPSAFLDAAAALIARGDVDASRLRIDFYSPDEAWLREAIVARRLGDVVRVLGTRPREEVLAAYRGADALLLLQWDSPGEARVMPAKTFEYLGSRRPILAVGAPSGGEVERVLADTSAGTVARTAEQTAAALLALYREWERDGHTSASGDPASIERYTQLAMAAGMLATIEAAIARREPRA